MLELIWLDGTESDYFDETTLFEENSRDHIFSHDFVYLGKPGIALYSTRIRNGISTVNYNVPGQRPGINRGKLRFQIKDGIIKSVIWSESGKPDWSNFQVNIIGSVDLDDKIGDLGADAKYLEGRKKLVSHLSKERNYQIVKEKKIKSGIYPACAICEETFNQKYRDEVAQGFIECHHLEPLSRKLDEYEIQEKDLILVCSNCHRMIHRWMVLNQDIVSWSPRELRSVLRKNV